MLKSLIYDHFKSLEKKEHEPSKVINFAPSYFCDCQRKIYYRKIHTEPSNPIDTHSYIKFAMGNATHDKLQNIFEDMEILLESEESREKTAFGLLWKYRVDAIIKLQKKAICEIKSTYASGWNSIEKEPKPEHVYQLLIYMLLERIPRGILLYIGRDNGYIVEYNFDMESIRQYKAKIKRGLQRFHKLQQNIEQKILPGRDFQIVLKNYKGNISEKFQLNKVNYKSNWRCGYCQWKNLCWEKELEQIKNHNFYINGKFI